LVMRYSNPDYSIGRFRDFNAVLNIITEPKSLKKIKMITDAFFVFGEKIQLNRLDDYSGVDLESDEGKDVIKGFRKDIEKINV